MKEAYGPKNSSFQLRPLQFVYQIGIDWIEIRRIDGLENRQSCSEVMVVGSCIQLFLTGPDHNNSIGATKVVWKGLWRIQVLDVFHFTETGLICCCSSQSRMLSGSLPENTNHADKIWSFSFQSHIACKMKRNSSQAQVGTSCFRFRFMNHWIPRKRARSSYLWWIRCSKYCPSLWVHADVDCHSYP